MAHLPDYSSRDLLIAWNGAIIDGLAPDNGIEFAPNANVTDYEVGMDGKVSISLLPDETGLVTLSLQQQSLSNQIFAEVINRQKQTRRIARGNLTISDPSGSVLAELFDCSIHQKPTVGFGSTATGKTRDWVFLCERMDFKFNAGNAGSFIQVDATFITSQVEAIFGITLSF
jgi:hypothetical protein